MLFRMRILKTIKLRFRVALFLLRLPLQLKRCSLPRLLTKLTPPAPRPLGLSTDDVRRAVDSLVFRPPFRWRPFPRTCLQRALALYRFLSLEGYAPQFSLGVARDRAAGKMDAHSRVLLDAKPFGEREDAQGRYHEIYTYPTLTSTTSSS
ncbi:MAG: lasso peptide biosynthesis B2 protein [Planctomycetota bacterium]